MGKNNWFGWILICIGGTIFFADWFSSFLSVIGITVCALGLVLSWGYYLRKVVKEEK